MQRRAFMKSAAMAAATAAVARLTGNAVAKGRGPSLRTSPHLRVIGDVRWDKAPCRFCGTGCHVQVGVKSDRVVAIAGDQLAEVNRGLLCVKGYHVGLALYGQDRLKTPLLRRNGKLEPITWEQAIDVISARVEKDPKGFAIYGSGQWTIPEGYVATKLVKAGLGTNQIDANARLCMSSAVTGFMSTYGVDEPAGCYDDLDRCDVVITWGNNPAEMHPILFSRMMDRRSRGEKVMLVDIGTRRTRTSSFADLALTIKPQADLALANGLMHLLIKRGTYDESFVRKFATFRVDAQPATLMGKAATFDEWKRLLEPYTPEHVSALTGIAIVDISRLADLFGDRNVRITSLWCMGVNQHTRGTAMNNLIHSVHLLSGHFGRPGDAPTSLTGQPSACGTVREVGTLAHALPGGLAVDNPDHRKEAAELWHVPVDRLNAKPGYHAVEMWKRFSTATEKGGDIHTIWVQVTNPGQTLPNLDALFAPSRKLADKFLIVSDVYPNATTVDADLVLPSALWIEKTGLVGNSERRTQHWFKMVEPPGDARDDTWQLLAVARRLYDKGFAGMRDQDGKFLFHIEKNDREVPFWQWEHFYDEDVAEHLFNEYRGFSRFKHKDLAPYQEYVKARGLRWPVVQQADGRWRETRFRFSGFDDPYVGKGKEIDFYHSVTKDGRAQIWFRPYEAPPEVPDDTFPFWLCTGRVLEHWHSGTMTMRIPPLRQAMPHAYVEMNPEDARRLGIGNGDAVALETRRGRLELPVWLEGRGVPPAGSLFVPFFDETLMINRLTLDAYDPFSKQPDYKKCAARVVPIRRPVAPAGRG